MSPEQQRLAIAEACGWREAFPRHNPPHPETKRGGILLPYTWVNEITHKRAQELPDFLNDLNAMHEAEACLTAEQYNPAYIEHLLKLCMDYEEMRQEPTEVLPVRIISATAAQRAEAFLRTLARWKADA